ncbi:MAG: hypothetical protein JXX14_03880 [Deltaproteobacteria bacterium]|nr:hypothetical protein [Deltaproteobacteria bacterium]
MSLATGLLIAMIGVLIAGLASIVGIWVERDSSRPKHWAFSLSALILMTTVVSMYQSYDDALASEKMEEDLARMLAQLDRIASDSDVEIPGLNDLLAKELEAQSRSNPDVVSKVSERVTADGGDANAMLSRHLPPSEMKGLPKDATDGANKGTANAAAQAEITKLKKQIAALEAEKNKPSEGEKKLKAELDELKTKVQQADEARAKTEATQKQAMDSLKAENEELKAELKKAKKASGGGGGSNYWSKKG